jgi:hypothetical protein
MTELEHEVLLILHSHPLLGWYAIEQRLGMGGVNTRGKLGATLRALIERDLIAETYADGDILIDVYLITAAGEAALNS